MQCLLCRIKHSIASFHYKLLVVAPHTHACNVECTLHTSHYVTPFYLHSPPNGTSRLQVRAQHTKTSLKTSFAVLLRMCLGSIGWVFRFGCSFLVSRMAWHGVGVRSRCVCVCVRRTVHLFGHGCTSLLSVQRVVVNMWHIASLWMLAIEWKICCDVRKLKCCFSCVSSTQIIRCIE